MIFKKSLKYYITQIISFSIINTIKQFWQEANTLKNAKNWVKKIKNKLIVVANNKIKGMLKKLATIEKISILNISANKFALGSSKSLNNSYYFYNQKWYIETIIIQSNLNRLLK